MNKILITEFMDQSAINLLHKKFELIYDDEIWKEINNLLYDDQKINDILSNSEIFLKKYLSNHGTSSKILIQEILKDNLIKN